MHIPIADTVLPTTMVGSYPRPQWFTQQLLGRDVRSAFKEAMRFLEQDAQSAKA